MHTLSLASRLAAVLLPLFCFAPEPLTESGVVSGVGRAEEGGVVSGVCSGDVSGDSSSYRTKGTSLGQERQKYKDKMLQHEGQ